MHSEVGTIQRFAIFCETHEEKKTSYADDPLDCHEASMILKEAVRKTTRPSKTPSRRNALLKTLLQLAVFWLLFLYVFPQVILWMETSLSVPGFSPISGWLFLAGFGLMGSGGFWSGMSMAWIGEGTPLPLDCAPKLVVRGPYAWVRNPMAVVGLSQGFFVALYLGSWLNLAYVLTGGLLWNFLVRPAEEDELHHRFGASFLHYQQAVRCWIPRISPYRPPREPKEDP